MNKTFDIVGLGYCGIDYIATVPYIPLDEKVEIIDFMSQGGGPAATAIVTASRLGAVAGFIGSVGNDEPGRLIIDGLIAENVDISRMLIQNNACSPLAFCWTEKSSGRRSIAWTKGGVSSLTTKDIDIDYISGARILHLDGHHTEAATYAAKTIKKINAQIKVSLDAGTILPCIDKLISFTDILIASEFFALKYTGENDISSASKKLLSEGPEVVVVTSGEKGYYGVNGIEEIIKPAFIVDVVDTTGAGDVFHGAFAVAYLQHWDLGKSLEFASAVAAIKCCKPGGRTGIPTMTETLQFLKEQELALWTN